MGTFATATVKARTRTLTITIDKTGFGGSSTTLSVSRNIRLVFGQPSTDQFGKAIMPSFVRLTFLDPDSTLWDEIISNSNDEGDFTVDISDGSEFKWQGFIRFDSAQRRLSTTTGVPEVDVYCYDGLSKLKELDAVTSIGSVHDIINSGLLSHVSDFDVEYVFENSITNETAYNATSLPYVDGFKFNTNVFVDSDGKPLSSAEQLEDMMETFNMRFWQRTYDTAGVSNLPRWVASHAYAVGQAANVAKATARWNGSAFVSEAIGVTAAAVTDNDISTDARYVLLRDAGAVETEIEIGLVEPEGSTAPVLETARDGQFADWTGAASDYWDKDSVDVVQTSGQATLVDTFTNGDYLQQKSIWVKKGTRFYVQLLFDHTNDGLNSGDTTTCEWRIEIGGSALQSDTFTTNDFLGGGAVDSGVLEVTATVDGQLGCEIRVTNFSGGNDTEVYIDDLSLYAFEDEGHSPLPKWTHRTGTPSVNNEVIKRSTVFENVIAVNALIITHTGSKQAAYFQEQEAGTKYDSIIEMAHQARLAMQNQNTLMIQGEIFGLWPPERAFTYGGATYRCAGGVELDLVDEVTSGTWKKKLKNLAT